MQLPALCAMSDKSGAQISEGTSNEGKVTIA